MPGGVKTSEPRRTRAAGNGVEVVRAALAVVALGLSVGASAANASEGCVTDWSSPRPWMTATPAHPVTVSAEGGTVSVSSPYAYGIVTGEVTRATTLVDCIV